MFPLLLKQLKREQFVRRIIVKMIFQQNFVEGLVTTD